MELYLVCAPQTHLSLKGGFFIPIGLLVFNQYRAAIIEPRQKKGFLGLPDMEAVHHASVGRSLGA